MPSERFDFPNASGEALAALIDLPSGKPSAYALFAHCFTCGKDTRAAKRIAEGLTARGIAVLRFDFTGLGASDGEFANTTFSSNVADLVAAADHLRRTRQAPAILIGHSLGGAAVLAAAAQVPEARAVVTIAAPSDPSHVTGLFASRIEELRRQGEIEVALAGRTFRIRREFLDDVAEQRLTDRVANLRKSLLIFHSPTDQIVGIDSASKIFLAARHPKSFVSLTDADHLLSRRGDGTYVANVIAAWAERYLDMAPASETAKEPSAEPRTVVVTETLAGRFQQAVTIGPHQLIADEPAAASGLDSGPGPYDLLLAGLGACTSMTLRMYAEHKKLPLRRVSVTLSHAKIHAADCASCETREGKIDRIDRSITLEGDLDAPARARLMEIADKCPVHRTLHSEVEIRTRESASGQPAFRSG
ncbi:putative redox protein [Rhizobiales bacterium GAS191]|nr:putative redox protein [Rhizobiales bacterium GAS113]SEE71349.1 putative redox protein [Rhizobiales bacterium GAS191]